jgi:hypothetical protein
LIPLEGKEQQKEKGKSKEKKKSTLSLICGLLY